MHSYLYSAVSLGSADIAPVCWTTYQTCWPCTRRRSWRGCGFCSEAHGRTSGQTEAYRRGIHAHLLQETMKGQVTVTGLDSLILVVYCSSWGSWSFSPAMFSLQTSSRGLKFRPMEARLENMYWVLGGLNSSANDRVFVWGGIQRNRARNWSSDKTLFNFYFKK